MFTIWEERFEYKVEWHKSRAYDESPELLEWVRLSNETFH